MKLTSYLSDWDRIAPPAEGQVVDYEDLANSESVQFLSKLAVLKLNGGLGTSMGCVGPKSVIEVRDGMSFLDLSVRQVEFLNRTYDVNVPFILMNSFNTNDDTQAIIKKYEVTMSTSSPSTSRGTPNLQGLSSSCSQEQ